MKALIQRVSRAGVEVSGSRVGEIGCGLLIFLGVDRNDDPNLAAKLADKVMNYRVFADEQGKMNLSLLDKQADLLVVSQFTLSADTGKGLRPSFTSAAPPKHAEDLYSFFVSCCREKAHKVETGRFGADMQVSLLNDGPVTFMLEV